jgi:PAS domain S-box-containing protein
LFTVKHNSPALAVLFIGIISAFLLYELAHNADFDTAYASFQKDSKQRAAAIEYRSKEKIALLHSIRAFYNSSTFVDRSEFKIFTRELISQNNHFQAVEWVPFVPATERPAFEQNARNDGFSTFQFTEKDANGTLIRADSREAYYPIYYLEPYQGNEAALGFDLGSNPERLAAIKKSQITGKAVASERITLVELKKDNAGILLFDPILKIQKTGGKTDRQESLVKGFILGVVQLSSLMTDFQSHSTPDSLHLSNGINLYLYDEEAPAGKGLLYSRLSHNKPPPQASPLSLKEAKSALHVEYPFTFGTRKWTIIATPTDPTFSAQITTQKWFMLASVLITTFLITALLITSAKRTMIIENTVFERTAALEVATQQALADAAHIRAIVDNSAEGIITIDESGIIHDANPAAEKIFDYTSSELIGKNISMLLPPEDRAMHTVYLKNSTLHETRIINQAREIYGYKKDGSTFPIELNVSSMKQADKRLFIGIIHDISERKQAETLKSEFVSTVSHELRTPLTSIKGALGLIASGAMGEMPKTIEDMVNIAYQNCERQIRLVNDLLDIEKLTTGKMEYHMEPVCLNHLLNQAVEENREFARSHQITYAITVSEPIAMVYADSGRILQVLANLLSNAAKFSSQNSEVQIILQKEKQCFRILVTDHGDGIPHAFRGKIFERFSQADASDTKAKGGTGLGLCISKTIIEEHNGKIGFESEEGKGSTFYIEMPQYHEPDALISA